jgi:hypothetical protein
MPAAWAGASAEALGDAGALQPLPFTQLQREQSSVEHHEAMLPSVREATNYATLSRRMPRWKDEVWVEGIYD